MQKKLIPQRLTVVRENMGISMAEASRILNLSKIGYCRYEYGERTPSPHTMEIIAQCFNTSVDYLTGISDDPLPDKIIIEKERDPILFEMVNICQNKDSNQAKRLFEYYNLIKSSQG